RASKRRSHWFLTLPVGFAAAASVFVGWWWHRGTIQEGRTSAPSIGLALIVEHDGTAVRGGNASGVGRVGDVLHTSASGARYRAVWIYRNDRELIAACPGGANCKEDDGSVSASVPLRAMGVYAVVAIASEKPLAQPRGILDEDVATAMG